MYDKVAYLASLDLAEACEARLRKFQLRFNLDITPEEAKEIEITVIEELNFWVPAFVISSNGLTATFLREQSIYDGETRYRVKETMRGNFAGIYSRDEAAAILTIPKRGIREGVDEEMERNRKKVGWLTAMSDISHVPSDPEWYKKWITLKPKEPESSVQKKIKQVNFEKKNKFKTKGGSRNV